MPGAVIDEPVVDLSHGHPSLGRQLGLLVGGGVWQAEMRVDVLLQATLRALRRRRPHPRPRLERR